MEELLAEHTRIQTLMEEIISIAKEQSDTETRIAFRIVLNNLMGRISRIYTSIQKLHTEVIGGLV
jgi:hypothetical protein